LRHANVYLAHAPHGRSFSMLDAKSCRVHVARDMCEKTLWTGRLQRVFGFS
jgi:hypothetical protein